MPLEEGNGLRVPVALPAVFGDALDAGLLPPETARRHLALQVSPQTGRLVVRQGAVFFEGHVPPGPGTQIRVRYALPIVAERMDLALRAPIELAAFSMSSEWTDKISPRIVPSKPYRAHRRVRADSVQQLMRLRDPVKAGEPIVLHVSRLPRPLEVHGAVALGGSLFLLFISLLALTAGWRRER